jgi:hypothetical protein
MAKKKVKNPSLYRAMRKLRKGGLHKALHVPENEVIPLEKVRAAARSKNGHLSKMANFALTMRGFKKGKKEA